MKRSVKLSLKKALAFCMVAFLLTGLFNVPAMADSLPEYQVIENDPDEIFTDDLLNDDLEKDNLENDDANDELNEDEMEDEVLLEEDDDVEAPEEFGGFSSFSSEPDLPTDFNIYTLKYDFTVSGITTESSFDFSVINNGGWWTEAKNTINISGDGAYSTTFDFSAKDPIASVIHGMGFIDGSLGAGFRVQVDKITVNNLYELSYDVAPVLSTDDDALEDAWGNTADGTVLCKNASGTLGLVYYVKSGNNEIKFEILNNDPVLPTDFNIYTLKYDFTVSGVTTESSFDFGVINNGGYWTQESKTVNISGNGTYSTYFDFSAKDPIASIIYGMGFIGGSLEADFRVQVDKITINDLYELYYDVAPVLSAEDDALVDAWTDPAPLDGTVICKNVSGTLGLVYYITSGNNEIKLELLDKGPVDPPDPNAPIQTDIESIEYTFVFDPALIDGEEELCFKVLPNNTGWSSTFHHIVIADLVSTGYIHTWKWELNSPATHLWHMGTLGKCREGESNNDPAEYTGSNIVATLSKMVINDSYEFTPNLLLDVTSAPSIANAWKDIDNGTVLFESVDEDAFIEHNKQSGESGGIKFFTYGIAEPEFEGMTTSRSMDYANAMGNGWNLGNSFDGFDTAFSVAQLGGGETAWNNPIVQRELIKYIADQGFGHIRIPMTANLRFTDKGAATPSDQLRYVLDTRWLARYREVVQWTLDEGMYAMINLHHDSWRWINHYDPRTNNKTFTQDGTIYTDFDILRAYEEIWTQLAHYFADMPDAVMFETINEPKFVNLTGTGAPSAQKRLDELNQIAVDIIRGIPGNEERMIVIPTWDTNHGDDHSNAARRLIGLLEDENILATVHYYHSNWAFSANLGVTMYGPSEQADVVNFFDSLERNFTSYGIGVTVGEWGLLAYDEGFPDFDGHLQHGEELKYHEHVNALSLEADGISLSFWDNGSGIMRWNGNNPRTNNFAWLFPRLGAMVASTERSSYATGLDTKYYRDAATGDLSIPLTLNGNDFIGIRGLTLGTDYTYAAETITLKQAYINSKFNAFNSFGVFDTLIFEFSKGNDWEYYLRKFDTPVIGSALGMRATGIIVPIEFNGARVDYVRAFNEANERVGNNNWAPGLQYDGGGYKLDYKQGSTSISHGRWFFDALPSGPCEITIEITYFDGQKTYHDLKIDANGFVSVGAVVPPPPIDDIPGTDIDTSFIVGKVNDAEDEEFGSGTHEVNLTLNELGQGGGGTVIPKEALDQIMGTNTVINISLEGDREGVKIALDTSTITGAAKPINFDMGVQFINADTKLYSNSEQGVIIPDDSLVITPVTTGDFGLELTITISAAKLAERGIDPENAYVFYIDRDGNYKKIEFTINREGEIITGITFTISKASRYLITEAIDLIKFDDNPDPPIITEKKPSGKTESGSTASASPITSNIISKKAEVRVPEKTIYAVTANFLNERTGPGMNFPTVGRLVKDTILEIREFSLDGKWALAHTGTWVSVQHLRHVSGPVRPEADITIADTRYSVLVKPNSRLFVRNAAGLQGKIVGTLRRGDIVNVTDIKNGWATITYTKDVPVAYISVQYLKLVQP